MNKTIDFIKRKTVMLCMAVAVMGGLASCEEHTDEYDGSLKVGNILLADNSIVSPQGYARRLLVSSSMQATILPW